VVQIKQR